MINELFEFIDGHRIAACIAAVVFIVAGFSAIYLLSAFSGPAQPAATSTALVTATPLPTTTPEPSPTVTPSPSPSPTATPAPSPTVTPDMAITRSISPLDQYAPNYMVWVDRSMVAGLLSIDPTNIDTAGQYAYRDDTYTVRLTLADTSNVSIDRIRIQVSCTNATGTKYTLYNRGRIDYVLLRPGDKISRTMGFTVAPDAPQGVYTLRIDISADLSGNGSWSDFGCSYESGLNILKAPS